jgi:Xaa-Pro aminopeptidase
MLRLPLSGQPVAADKLEREWLRERFPGIVLRHGFPPLTQMRARKDTAEIRLIQRAVALTERAFHRLWKEARPGMGEWELRAILEAAMCQLGADAVAFPSIVAAGSNACILHYTAARHRVRHGDLVLVDCGAEYAGYAADITRTFPISGRFSPEQRILYEAVLEAQDSALAACAPGVPFREPHRRAYAVLERRLRELGIIHTEEEVRRYFPHATSHHLGLDVHDVGPTDTLRPGFVITVEPGLYIPPGSPCEQRWWGIGIRIEDDVLITDTGAVVLSASLPRRVEELEALLSSQMLHRNRGNE